MRRQSRPDKNDSKGTHLNIGHYFKNRKGRSEYLSFVYHPMSNVKTRPLIIPYYGPRIEP
jgi:hypothetical protein